MMVDMEFLAYFTDFLLFERKTIICNDRLGHTIPTYDVIKDELIYLLTGNIGHLDGFNQFCKVLSHGEDEFMTTSRCRVNLSHEIESPLREWPQCRN